MSENFLLGHFLKEHHIEKAIELISFQLSQRSPLYNNLDFSLYRIEEIANVNAKVFYSDYVARDALYYFENLFYSRKYFSIQRAYKIREFHYLSLHALIVFYAIGLYIRDLMNDNIIQEQQMYAQKPMHIYYGGRLNYEAPAKSEIFYYEDYRDFLAQKEKLTTPEAGEKIFAISLDIKSFFYTVSHGILLSTIGRKAGAYGVKTKDYDEDSKRSIAVFFELLQYGNIGLPVSSQNLISSFLSSIYLSVLDNYVLDKYVNIGNFQYLRYVDDFYLIFKVDASKDDSLLREQIYDIENDIAHFLMHELQLSVSTEKSKRFEIVDSKSQIEFLKSSSLDSPFDLDFDYEAVYSQSVLSVDSKGKTTPDIFNECINILSVLKAQSARIEQLSLSLKESAFLNYILILKSCLAYSRSKEAADHMDKFLIFENISSIDYILIKPKVFLHLITVNKRNRDILFTFIVKLLTDGKSIFPKLTLLDKYIHQMFFLIFEAKGADRRALEQEFDTHIQTVLPLLHKLKSKLPQIQYLDLIECVLTNNRIQVQFAPIYPADFLNSKEGLSLMQQIKLRRISEQNENYSVSLNHMINEFQNLFGLKYFNSENKTALDITTKMNGEKYPSDHILFVSNIFKRRNENSVSHPNSPEIGLWSVHLSEYNSYKLQLYAVLQRVYNASAVGQASSS